MKSTGRRVVVGIAITLIMGLGWYEMRWSKPRTVPSMAANAVSFIPGSSAEPPRSTVGKRGDQSDSKDTEGRETVVCGMGTVPIDPHERAAPFNYVDRLTAAAQKRWRKSLLDSDDNHERAAGLMLQSSGWDFDPITKMPTRTHDAALARDELVQLAAGLNDVPIYAMAMRACDPADDGGERGAACVQISAAKWAAMDPDNAAPWLEMALAAHVRADRAAEIDAVSHAARAHSVNFYNDSLLAYATPGMPPETSTLERAAFFDGLIGNVGGDGFSHSYASHTYCSAAAVQDSAIHQQCEALAEVFADFGRNTSDSDAAARIGERVGWPAERVTALRQEMLAIYRVSGHSNKNLWSCDIVRGVNLFADIQAKSGELAAARAAIQASGKSIPELAQEQLDFVRQQAANAGPQNVLAE
jgi:hypothetical protein